MHQLVSTPPQYKYTAATKGGRSDGTRTMLNTADEVTCPVLDEPDNAHLEGRCEDCDARTLSRLTLDQAGDRYLQGRFTQSQFEAHDAVFWHLYPASNRPLGLDELPDALRIARKILHFHGEGK